MPLSSQESPPTDSHQDSSTALRRAIQCNAALLPIPGPIHSFALLNTLAALEDLPFDEGLQRGARLFGCEPYCSEATYRQHLASGRIQPSDLEAVLAGETHGPDGARPGGLSTRHDLRLAMLRFPLRMGPAAELDWFIEETDALSTFRADAPVEVRRQFLEQSRHWALRDLRDSRGIARSVPAALRNWLDESGFNQCDRWNDARWEAFTLRSLWFICRAGVAGVVDSPRRLPEFIRHRDALLAARGEDSDARVNGVLIPFCAAFLDQGFADWTLPDRERGFYRAFVALYRHAWGPLDEVERFISVELGQIVDRNISPLDSIVESLAELGVGANEWDDYLGASLRALPGWAGMIWQSESRGDRVSSAAPPGSLIEYLAIRLILERCVLRELARRTWGEPMPLAELREAARARLPAACPDDLERRAFPVFQLAQVLGWTPDRLLALDREAWGELSAEIETFSSLDRRRLLHQAFERRLHHRALDALAIGARRPVERVAVPRFQACFCIDAREESFRRHLEEHSPDVETFSHAGFFNVPIYYRGVGDAHFRALCPVVVRPRYWLTEEVVLTLKDSFRRRSATRRAWGTASQHIHHGSRSLAAGALLTASLGVLASIPLVARVLFPRLTARFSRTAGALVGVPGSTRLRLERTADQPGPETEGIGFTLDEMTELAERNLRDIGLIDGFARLVFIIGHGSDCLNNPHRSVYDCGACSGNAGGPNARALAAMLNDWRVRERLQRRGIEIPATTAFLGGLHNTCRDTLSFADLDLLPPSHTDDFLSARRVLEEVCARNAHERCRRFNSAPLTLSRSAARQHVERRAEDLAETRPEYGNASNALCVVGRRARTRGLYLDRRSFLMSYDPRQDDARGSILARILAAVIPVCEGINLQYTLSAIDNDGWGCGTKLPHNITSLLGVMDGAASDLRPGLPLQGVEIHEPVRLLFVIETTVPVIEGIMASDQTVGRILRHGWARLALLDPDDGLIRVLGPQGWSRYEPEVDTLPVATSSLAWYRGWRDHLPFAEIRSPTDRNAPSESARS